MRYFIVLMMVALTWSLTKAQSYDERDLLGQWELETCEGQYYGFTEGDYDMGPAVTYKYLYFGTLDTATTLPGTNILPTYYEEMSGGCFYDSDENNGSAGEELGIHDFFISNSNKLHISVAHYENVFRFVIQEFDAQRLHLVSYDGKCDVIYKRVTHPTNVRAVEVEEKKNTNTYYSIDGKQTNIPCSGVNIVVNGSNVTKEIK